MNKLGEQIFCKFDFHILTFDGIGNIIEKQMKGSSRHNLCLRYRQRDRIFHN